MSSVNKKRSRAADEDRECQSEAGERKVFRCFLIVVVMATLGWIGEIGCTEGSRYHTVIISTRLILCLDDQIIACPVLITCMQMSLHPNCITASDQEAEPVNAVTHL